MQLTFLIFGLLGLFDLTFAVMTTAGELPWPLEVMQYSGTLGGYDVQLNGTVQEIFAQMKVLHPDFVLPSAETAAGPEKNLTSRGASAKDGILCCPVAGQDWTYGSTDMIMEGITYLNRLGHRINVGGRACSRISCSYDASIYLCNDNPYSINPAPIYVASYAQDLVNTCTKNWNSPILPTTCGQEFDSDNYNVIVSQANPVC